MKKKKQKKRRSTAKNKYAKNKIKQEKEKIPIKDSMISSCKSSHFFFYCKTKQEYICKKSQEVKVGL